MNLEKVYYNEDGKVRNIYQMVEENPLWAANRIQAGEVALEGLDKIIVEVKKEIRKL